MPKSKKFVNPVGPWESIPLSDSKPDGTQLTRLGDSAFYIKPYEFGFVVSKISRFEKEKRYFMDEPSYISDIYGVARILLRNSTRLDGELAKDFKKALDNTNKILKIVEELQTKEF